MSRILIYCKPDMSPYAIRRRDELRAQGHKARVVWIGRDMSRMQCDEVEVIGEPDGRIEELYGDLVRSGEDPVADYRVEQSGSWWRAHGPDGQIGRAVRTEAEAWALVQGVRNAGLD